MLEIIHHAAHAALQQLEDYNDIFSVRILYFVISQKQTIVSIRKRHEWFVLLSKNPTHIFQNTEITKQFLCINLFLCVMLCVGFNM